MAEVLAQEGAVHGLDINYDGSIVVGYVSEGRRSLRAWHVGVGAPLGWLIGHEGQHAPGSDATRGESPVAEMTPRSESGDLQAIFAPASLLATANEGNTEISCDGKNVAAAESFTQFHSPYDDQVAEDVERLPGAGSNLYVGDLGQAALLTTRVPNMEYVSVLAFKPDGRELAVAGNSPDAEGSYSVFLFDTATAKLRLRISAPRTNYFRAL